MAEVVALRRPPVRQSALVRAGRQHTFDTFMDTIGRRDLVMSELASESVSTARPRMRQASHEEAS